MIHNPEFDRHADNYNTALAQELFRLQQRQIAPEIVRRGNHLLTLPINLGILLLS